MTAYSIQKHRWGGYHTCLYNFAPSPMMLSFFRRLLLPCLSLFPYNWTLVKACHFEVCQWLEIPCLISCAKNDSICTTESPQLSMTYWPITVCQWMENHWAYLHGRFTTVTSLAEPAIQTSYLNGWRRNTIPNVLCMRLPAQQIPHSCQHGRFTTVARLAEPVILIRYVNG